MTDHTPTPDTARLTPEVLADADALRDYLDARNEKGGPIETAGVDARGNAFLAGLVGAYAEDVYVVLGNPWDPEVDWNTGTWCEECNASNMHGMDHLAYPVTVLTAARESTPAPTTYDGPGSEMTQAEWSEWSNGLGDLMEEGEWVGLGANPEGAQESMLTDALTTLTSFWLDLQAIPAVAEHIEKEGRDAVLPFLRDRLASTPAPTEAQVVERVARVMHYYDPMHTAGCDWDRRGEMHRNHWRAAARQALPDLLDAARTASGSEVAAPQAEAPPLI